MTGIFNSGIFNNTIFNTGSGSPLVSLGLNKYVVEAESRGVSVEASDRIYIPGPDGRTARNTL